MGGGVWAEAQAGAADGRPSRDDVGSLSRCVALTTAFPSHRVSGGRPPPIQPFPQWGVVGGAEGSEVPTPPLCDFGNHCCLSLSLPLLTSHLRSHWASTLGLLVQYALSTS